MIVTICYDHQSTESAINYLSKEHNRTARVDFEQTPFQSQARRCSGPGLENLVCTRRPLLKIKS